MVQKLLLASLLFSSLSIGTPTLSVRDGSPKPVVIVPDTDSANQGSEVGFTITCDETSSSATTIQLSSANSTRLPVPSTVTLPANSLTCSFRVETPTILPAPGSAAIQVTASANGGSAYGSVTLN
jgi:hypothetical protein